jgi:hypothetical protein
MACTFASKGCYCECDHNKPGAIASKIVQTIARDPFEAIFLMYPCAEAVGRLLTPSLGGSGLSFEGQTGEVRAAFSRLDNEEAPDWGAPGLLRVLGGPVIAGSAITPKS